MHEMKLDEISEIIPNKLYLTNYTGANKKEEISKLNISHIISFLYPDEPIKNISYLNME